MCNSSVGFVLSKNGERWLCRVGKGGGTAFRHSEGYRAPCPRTGIDMCRAVAVGTAHDRPVVVEKTVPLPLPTLHCKCSFACVGFVLPKSVCDPLDCAEISAISLSHRSFFIRWVRFAKSANSSRALRAHDRLLLSVSTSSMLKRLVANGASIANCAHSHLS